MTDLDLTDAVEAAARAWFERGQKGRMDAGRFNNDGTHIRWEQIGRLDQHAYRELVLPIVHAAAPHIAEQGERGVTTSRSGATLAGSSRSQSRRALPRVPVQRATPRRGCEPTGSASWAGWASGVPLAAVAAGDRVAARALLVLASGPDVAEGQRGELAAVDDVDRKCGAVRVHVSSMHGVCTPVKRNGARIVHERDRLRAEVGA